MHFCSLHGGELMKTLQISAGGNGTRISDFMNSQSIFLPKHLLPLPTNNETI